ncbi:hypothetical protein R1CP_40395 (plasmid) [Rhodococcus opacus]|uniref:Uncharacterized protein n=1 Tax=Rhodococcus opacus TaxID=37919 RepID=A0A1B1KJ66_RHOOP|nr:hypothetical protein R1CP_40395 [Rhodococcus opacus]
MIAFDSKRASGAAAYHHKRDELVFDLELRAIEIVDTYAFEGLILHELGHRAAPLLTRSRRSVLYFGAAVLFVASWWYLLVPSAPIVPMLLFAFGLFLSMLGLAFFVALSWLCEFRADDYACDHGGIARAAAFLNWIEVVPEREGARWTHPPTLMRYHRQLRRASLPR